MPICMYIYCWCLYELLANNFTNNRLHVPVMLWFTFFIIIYINNILFVWLTSCCIYPSDNFPMDPDCTEYGRLHRRRNSCLLIDLNSLWDWVTSADISSFRNSSRSQLVLEIYRRGGINKPTCPCTYVYPGATWFLKNLSPSTAIYLHLFMCTYTNIHVYRRGIKCLHDIEEKGFPFLSPAQLPPVKHLISIQSFPTFMYRKYITIHTFHLSILKVQ
jgi:hypothetical protein